MAATQSTMLSLGTSAPEFSLFDTNGESVRLDTFQGAKALLIIFMSNHCPYVKHVRPVLVPLIKKYQEQGVAVVGINSNDVESYPDDSPERMAEDSKEYNYTFPYCFDSDQAVAKSYKAACTPDFFVFDKEYKLVYRGQMDNSRPGNGVEVTGSDLSNALDAVIEGKPVLQQQKPSIGCNIKWKAGNEPDYFNHG